jgi:hypothetical protein
VRQNFVTGSYQCGSLTDDLVLCAPVALAPGTSGCVLRFEEARRICSCEAIVSSKDALRDLKLASVRGVCRAFEILLDESW